uniref:Response regulatory domain-containing protein n=1 Tax=Chlamydomonas leiostraca TaxID=1034604 RepID=A0A7S0WQF3_9CHLO|mmetsp:Transcript_23315/g.59624  ORF Transcript_23315/g.59624 Transcript_23315/m.59624 type:complete len:185 (+) Transcript_23315:230-784(+)
MVSMRHAVVSASCEGQVLPLLGGDAACFGRVLIADDLAINRKVLSKLVLRAGLQPVECMDGAECCSLVSSSAPNSWDMILMDLNMPKLDGWQATKQLREWEAENDAQHDPDTPPQSRIPIVACTAEPSGAAPAGCSKDAGQHALECGVDDVVGKPLSYEELCALLRRYVPAWQPAPTTSAKASA